MYLSEEIDIKLYQNFTKRIYVRYTSVSRTTNSLQWQCSILVTWYRWRHVTVILHCHWLELWWRVPDAEIILSIISIIDEKLLNSYNNRSKLKFLRLFWDIVVFRLVAYLLNMISLILRILYKILHMYEVRFGIILTQFYVNFSRQEHQIKLLYVSIN